MTTIDHKRAQELAHEFADPAAAWERTQAFVALRSEGRNHTADALEQAVEVSRAYLALLAECRKPAVACKIQSQMIPSVPFLKFGDDGALSELRGRDFTITDLIERPKGVGL
jgi:hypothetical protein